jgi:predicted nicotinamide N-methyase
VVADIESLITDLSREDEVPCWADVWPAAEGLARYIWERLTFDEKEVLELGAGLGLPGVVCALKGGRITFSDFQERALVLALKNARLNGVQQAQVLQEDWRFFKCSKKFDWIIGSDILYDPGLNPSVGKILKRNLLPGGSILLSHPGRKQTFDFLSKWLDPEHFSEEREVLNIVVDDPLLPYQDITVHKISNIKV